MAAGLTEERLGKRPRGREVIFDKRTPGLLVRGGPRGWMFYLQEPKQVAPDGTVRRSWRALGPHSLIPGAGLSLSEARKSAREAQGKFGEQVPASITVRALAEDWLDQRYPDNAGRKAKVAGLLERHALPAIGGMPVRGVTRNDCVQTIREALKRGRAPAASLIRTLRLLFRHAAKTGKLETLAQSPAELLEAEDFGIKPGPKRQRWLTAEEVAALLLHQEIDLPGMLSGVSRPRRNGFPEMGVSLAVRAAVVLGPHLALRPVALCGMRWDEVDFKNAALTVRGGRGAKLPHHQRAEAQPFVVPLSPTPLALLKALKKTQEAQGTKSAFVLASCSAAGHLTTDVLADALMRLTKHPRGRIQLAGGQVRPHDARRTFVAAATQMGVQELITERALQHSRGAVADTYFVAGSEFERRREAHERVDAYWTAVREGKPAKVVTLRAGR